MGTFLPPLRSFAKAQDRPVAALRAWLDGAKLPACEIFRKRNYGVDYRRGASGLLAIQPAGGPEGKRPELMIYLRFWVMACAVSEYFFNRFDSVS